MKELPQDIEEMDARIKNLKSKKRKQAKHKDPRLMWQIAFRVAAEFVSPIIIGLCIGYGIDEFFATKPMFMLIMVIFGCAAGMLNVYRIAKSMDKDI